MIQEVTRYTTHDGSVFATIQQAQDHETYLERKPEVDAFLDKYYPLKTEGKNGPARAIAQSAVARWLSDKR